MKPIKEEYYNKIKEYLNEYTDENGISPSYAEMERSLGIPKATLSRYISRMKEMGMLTSGGHRGIRTKENMSDGSRTVRAPMYENVYCGVTEMPETDVLDYVKLPVAIFGDDECFIVTAKGTSMTNAGIDEGDVLVIRRQNTADRGDIVIALYSENEKTTCKYYDPDKVNGICYLRAASDFDEDIVAPLKDVMIQGVLINIIKKPSEMRYSANLYRNGNKNIM